MSRQHDFAYFDALIARGVDTAVVDIDGTITNSHIGLLYLHLRRREFRSTAAWLGWYAIFMASYGLYFALLDCMDRTRCQAALYGLYDRYSAAELERGAEELFRGALSTRFISYVHDLLFHLKKRGVRIVLLTTNLDIIAEQYARYFGVEAIGMPMAAIHRSAERGKLLRRDFKREMVKAFDPASTLAIADSRYDLPVLQRVHYPVIVTAKGHSAWMSSLKHAAILEVGNR